MPRRVRRPAAPAAAYVDFDFENRTYQIDPRMKKVYRRFVEIETAKAAQILSIWRERLANA